MAIAEAGVNFVITGDDFLMVVPSPESRVKRSLGEPTATP
jgi:hypothetical protein